MQLGFQPVGVGLLVDEAVLRFAGNWGILDLGDEDGVQNLMDYDAATIMTAQAGFDGGVTAIFTTSGRDLAIRA